MKPRLLGNENFPAPSIRLLRDLGYDVAAVAEKRWIVTFDRDYDELIFAGVLDARTGDACVARRMRADRLLYQAKLALDPALRLKVVRKMYAMRFGEEPPERRSVEQLRGIEGARVREMYKRLARK